MRYSLKDLKEAKEGLIELVEGLTEIKEMEENPDKTKEEVIGDVQWGVKIAEDFLGVHCLFYQKGEKANVSLDFFINGESLPFEDDRIRGPIMWAFFESERDKNKNKAFH